MFFILKLVLIFLLNKTYAYITQDIERILLPTWNSTSAKEIPLTLKILGKQIQLNLRRNDQIVSSKFKLWKYDARSITEKLSQLNASDPCYYLHKDHISTAAINFCQEHGWEGFIFLKDDTLEIRPLRNDYASLSSIDDFCVKEEMNISFGKPHLIKRSLQLSADSSFHNLDNFKLKRRDVQNMEEKLTVELAIIVDEAVYNIFMPLLHNDEKILHMMILAYVNNIQAAFHHPSLGVSIDISLVHLEIMNEQSSDLPTYGGSAVELLDSFCNYLDTRNPSDDNDPRHSDVGLYITGLNITHPDYNVVGLANATEVCESNTACAIVEFGTAHILTSGFASSFVAAHEIGHILGLRHDTDYMMPLCDKYKHIMSPFKLRYDQVTWSECSQMIATHIWDTKECLRDHTINLKDVYDHSRYEDLPGRQWTAKAQCEVYFRDKNANVVSLLDICKTLQCETPKGTYCAPGKECHGGECVPVQKPPIEYCDYDNWSKWEEDTCRRSCLEKSKGVIIRRRSCQHGIRRTASCKEPYYDVALCDASIFCNASKRKTNSDFATEMCIQFSNMTYELKGKLGKQPGRQVPHNVEEPWQACTIHCLKNDSFVKELRSKMIKFDFDPYFPDGTWCHNKNGKNYYCQQHYCRPVDYSSV
ncbi:A disintegrin and metalloproteinase with thrombospondin motifs 7-like isoform X2 [Linepithema humile]|uniref:A disintegrin and metalloproteinase with thrombospondin motifs 7-like isoform X2 n=1 Tax=Linepithema humile TaxID=83485 RepID=UPI00351E5293